MTAPTDSRRVIELTASQRAVLGQLTLDGADNPTIAARLNITVHTVKSHVRGIMDAFGVPTRTAVVVDCLRGRVSIRGSWRTVVAGAGRARKDQRHEPCYLCVTSSQRGERIDDAVLPLLALPYADHPDYDENWRP